MTMARTTRALVQQVLGSSEVGGDWDTRRDLTPFIDAATLAVTRVAACAVRKGLTLTAEELEVVERWLAAHLYCMSDQQYQSKSTKASATFRAAGGLNLDGSTYGQTAKSLDPSGCLAALSLQQRAGAAWLGKRPTAQTDYEDRR